MNPEYMKGVVSLLKEEMQSYMPLMLCKIFQGNQNNASLMLSQINLQEPLSEKVAEEGPVHPDTQCRKCGVTPIRGVRFRCFVCKDYDLCEVCEMQDSHSERHAIIKIKKPEIDPTNNEIILKRFAEHYMKHYMVPSKEEFKDQLQESNVLYSEYSNINESRMGAGRGEAKPPKAKFLRESFGDKQQVEAGKEFSKTWTFRNDGEESWPADAKFVFINGAEFGETVKDIGVEVKPGDTYEVTVQFKAPKNVGTYCGFYRFSYGSKKKHFG